mgnify:FL=1
MQEIKVTRVTCLRCGHEWQPRKAEVYVCPRCHSALWGVVKPIKSPAGPGGPDQTTPGGLC